MTKPNDTEKKYKQLMRVQRCINAFKDLSDNIPDEDRYAPLMSLISENLDKEFKELFVLTLN